MGLRRDAKWVEHVSTGCSVAAPKLTSFSTSSLSDLMIVAASKVTNLRELQLRPKYVNKRGNKLKDFMSSTQFSAISTNECFRYSGGLDVSTAGYLRHCQFHHKSFSSRSLKSRYFPALQWPNSQEFLHTCRNVKTMIFTKRRSKKFSASKTKLA